MSILNVIVANVVNVLCIVTDVCRYYIISVCTRIPSW